MTRKPIAGLFFLLLPLAASPASLSVQLNGADGAGVEGVIVYLDGVSAPAAPAAAPLEIHQRGKRFTPYLGVVARDTDVVFINDDDITHHVYSFNGPSRFSFVLEPGETNDQQRFDENGVMAMGCNIHDWMSGYLLVLDNPWFASTDAGGHALITGVPPGRYRLTAWHPQLQEPAAPAVMVEVSGDVEAALRLTAPMAAIPTQEDLNDFDFLEDY